METIRVPLIRLWFKYKSFVEIKTRDNIYNTKEDITCWRERLFTHFITYFWPISLIALIPGAIIGFTHGYSFISSFGILSGAAIFIVVFNTRLSLIFRKAFFLLIIYILAVVLIIDLGSFGPGLIYLFSLSIFITLIFKQKIAYWSVALNILICILCGITIDRKLFNIPLIKEYDTGSWTAVSSNLIFLNLISVALISSTIDGLEATIVKKIRLRSELRIETVKRIRGNQLLKESENHYRTLFFQNPAPMWVLDAKNFMFLQVNEAAIKKYGYTNEEFMTMTVEDIKLEIDKGTLHQDIQKNHASNTPRNSVISKHRKKNEEQFFVEVTFNTITFKGKKGILTTARDITDQINYTKAIEKQNEKLQEIAHIQSHDVRAPLVRIMGLVGLMSKDTDESLDPIIIDYLDQSAKDLDDVIRKITDKAWGENSEPANL